MRTDRTRWAADRGVRALRAMNEIQASIETLADEDLLDLHDIFHDQPRSAIGEFASLEVRKRELTP